MLLSAGQRHRLRDFFRRLPAGARAQVPRAASRLLPGAMSIND